MPRGLAPCPPSRGPRAHPAMRSSASTRGAGAARSDGASPWARLYQGPAEPGGYHLACAGRTIGAARRDTVSGPSDDAGAEFDRPDNAAPEPSAPESPEPSGLSNTSTPSRRDAILRIGIVVGVLVVVFGIILPRFIDYQDVIATLQGLTIQDFVVVGVFGVIAWVLTG